MQRLKNVSNKIIIQVCDFLKINQSDINYFYETKSNLFNSGFGVNCKKGDYQIILADKNNILFLAKNIR